MLSLDPLNFLILKENKTLPFLLYRIQNEPKFIRHLKKYLNILVDPSPNLQIDDFFDTKTKQAVSLFQAQWMNKVYSYPQKGKTDGIVTLATWGMIGLALGQQRLLSELRQIPYENELRSLLLGLFDTSYQGYYTKEMEACDTKLASIFGGKNAIISANGFEPDSLSIYRKVGGFYNYTRPTHFFSYILHLYGSIDGTRFGVDGRTYTDIYIPDGFEEIANANRNIASKKKALTQTPTLTQSGVTFYYKN